MVTEVKIPTWHVLCFMVLRHKQSMSVLCSLHVRLWSSEHILWHVDRFTIVACCVYVKPLTRRGNAIISFPAVFSCWYSKHTLTWTLIILCACAKQEDHSRRPWTETWPWLSPALWYEAFRLRCLSSVYSLWKVLEFPENLKSQFGFYSLSAFSSVSKTTTLWQLSQMFVAIWAYTQTKYILLSVFSVGFV